MRWTGSFRLEEDAMFSLKRFTFILPIGIFVTLLFIAVSPGSPMAATLHYSCSAPNMGTQSGTRTYSTRSECESEVQRCSRYCTCSCTGDGSGSYGSGTDWFELGKEWRRRHDEEMRAIEKERERKAQEEEERRKAVEEKKRKEFVKKRDNAYRLLREVTDTGGSERRAREGLNCASYLARKSAEAAARGAFNEARFLGGQSAEAMSGGSLRVICPDTHDPSGIEAPTSKEVSVEDAPQKRLYDRVFKLIEEKTARIEKIEENMNVLTEKKQGFEEEIKTQESTLEELRLATAIGGTPQGALEKDEMKKEAASMLERAMMELAKAEKELEEVVKERNEMRDSLEGYRAIMEDVEKNPSSASGYLERLSR